MELADSIPRTITTLIDARTMSTLSCNRNDSGSSTNGYGLLVRTSNDVGYSVVEDAL